MHRRTFISALPLALAGETGMLFSRQQEKAPTAEPYEDHEAYAVYAAALLLNRPHQEAITGAKLLVIEKHVEAWTESTIEWSGIKLNKGAERDWLEVLRDYVQANQVARELKDLFPIDRPYKLITAKERDEALKGKWETYYKRFPKGSGPISFSSVGFNKPKTRAIVNVFHICHYLCGGGGPHFLEKRDEKWREVRVDATVQVIAI